MAVHALIDSLYLKELAKKVKRGLAAKWAGDSPRAPRKNLDGNVALEPRVAGTVLRPSGLRRVQRGFRTGRAACQRIGT